MNSILTAGDSVMEKIMGVIPSILQLGGTCFEAVVENPVTLVYVGVTFIGVGFGIFGMMKRSARGR